MRGTKKRLGKSRSGASTPAPKHGKGHPCTPAADGIRLLSGLQPVHSPGTLGPDGLPPLSVGPTGVKHCVARFRDICTVNCDKVGAVGKSCWNPICIREGVVKMSWAREVWGRSMERGNDSSCGCPSLRRSSSNRPGRCPAPSVGSELDCSESDARAEL